MKVLDRITERANERRLDFVLVGGHAVIVHGYGRTTFDLDLIVRRTDQAAWSGLLLGLGYVAQHEGPTFLQFNARPNEPWPVDLMFVNAETFDKLLAAAKRVEIGKSSVPVASLMHLIGLKCHAIRHGHPGRVVKDMDDLLHLIEINQLSLTEPALREIVLKFGTTELYEKIERVFRPN